MLQFPFDSEARVGPCGAPRLAQCVLAPNTLEAAKLRGSLQPNQVIAHHGPSERLS